jgi:ubiquinone biosynthesis protein COQ9
MNLREDATAPSERYRVQLLEAMLELAPEEGWTPGALGVARIRCGLSEGETELACPDGVGDLLAEFGRRLEREVFQRVSEADLQGLRIREKVAFGVRTYLSCLEPFRSAVRRALVSPYNVMSGPKGVWSVADAIWSALGDRSTDFNWYSKRTILSGVIASTLLVWLDGDETETEAFLERRIGDVMTFEKTKGRISAFFKRPDGADAGRAASR